MIGARRLLALARTPTGRDAAGDVSEGLQMIARAKLPLHANGLKLPSRPDLLEGLRDALNAAEDEGLLVEVVALIRQPTRAFELSAEDGARRLLLLASFAEPDGPRPVAAELMVPARGSLSATWHRLDRAPEDLARGLEQFHLDIPLEHQPLSDRDQLAIDRVLIIGGSDHEAMAPGWTARVRAIAQAQGFSATLFENVAPRIEATQQRARTEFRGRAQYVMAEYCGGPENVKRLDRSGYGRSFVIAESDADDQLIMLRLLLDDLAETLPDPPEPQSQFTPTPGADYYFKKIAPGGGGKGDVMVLKASPCSHSKWTGGHKGDQARMGITSLVGCEPNALHKCPECLGGGFWRARF